MTRINLDSRLQRVRIVSNLDLVVIVPENYKIIVRIKGINWIMTDSTKITSFEH